jgi:hypothetical protein
VDLPLKLKFSESMTETCQNQHTQKLHSCDEERLSANLSKLSKSIPGNVRCIRLCVIGL